MGLGGGRPFLSPCIRNIYNLNIKFTLAACKVYNKIYQSTAYGENMLCN